jgi:hypothetical protein
VISTESGAASAEGLSRGDAGPDTLARLNEYSGTDQTFDNPGCRLRRNLEGVAQAIDRDEWRAAMDDFFEDGPDDLGTPGRVATVQFHKASLPAGVR